MFMFGKLKIALVFLLPPSTIVDVAAGVCVCRSLTAIATASHRQQPLSGQENERQQRAAKWMETNDALIELSGRQAANERILLGHENCMTLDFILVLFFCVHCLFSSFHENDTEALVLCEERMWWHAEC